MTFRVEQERFPQFGLAREYGKVIGRARRSTILGKIMAVTGVPILLFSILIMISILELLPQDPDAVLGYLVGLLLNLLMALMGLKMSGLCPALIGFSNLLFMRKERADTSFYHDYFEDISSGVRTECQYSKVKAVFEGKKAFFLQLYTNSSLIMQFVLLPKDCFTLGAPDAFRRFMDERTGRPVIILSKQISNHKGDLT